MRERPWLVQRLERHREYGSGLVREYSDRKGVDRYFGFEYMGSSEFEWGALPSSLSKMRAIKPPLKRERMTCDEHVVWYVGEERFRSIALNFFEDQLLPHPNHRLKEWTNIAKVYGLDKPTTTTIGWWCVDDDMTFALFRNESDAKLWIKGLKDGPKK